MIRFNFPRRLLAPDGDASSAPAPEAVAPTPAPQPPLTPPNPSEKPPATRIVVEGRKDENSVALEQKLKEREIRVNTLEDENRTLREALKPSPPQPHASEQKQSFLSGWPFD